MTRDSCLDSNYQSYTVHSIRMGRVIDIHHRSIVGYTKSRVDAGLGYMILSSFEDVLHENSLEKWVVLEVG